MEMKETCGNMFLHLSFLPSSSFIFLNLHLPSSSFNPFVSVFVFVMPYFFVNWWRETVAMCRTWNRTCQSWSHTLHRGYDVCYCRWSFRLKETSDLEICISPLKLKATIRHHQTSSDSFFAPAGPRFLDLMLLIRNFLQKSTQKEGWMSGCFKNAEQEDHYRKQSVCKGCGK